MKGCTYMVEESIEISSEDIFGLIAFSGDAKASYHAALHLLRENKVKAVCEPKGVAIDVINTVDYGMMNGAKVLEHAIKLANK